MFKIKANIIYSWSIIVCHANIPVKKQNFKNCVNDASELWYGKYDIKFLIRDSDFFNPEAVGIWNFNPNISKLTWLKAF